MLPLSLAHKIGIPIITILVIILTILCIILVRLKRRNQERKRLKGTFGEEGSITSHNPPSQLSNNKPRERSSLFSDTLKKRRGETIIMNGNLFPNLRFLRVPVDPSQVNPSGSEMSLFRSSSESVFSDVNSENSSGDSPDALQDNNAVTSIEFNVNYFSSTSTLNITVLRVNSIPQRFRKCAHTYVKVSLKSVNGFSKTKRFKSKIIKNSLNPSYDEEIPFDGYDYNELKKYRIRFACFAKYRKFTKKALIGDVYVPLNRPDFEADTLLGCRERLSLTCPLTGKRGPLMLAGDLGFLNVDLDFNRESRGLKVNIRKAQNLPIHGGAFSVGYPEHYVIITLMRKNEIVTFKETRTFLGANPAVNQSFVFDVDDGQINDYWLQILIMRGKFYSKDGSVGHVMIGCNTSLLGKQHWIQATESESSVEINKWHEITHISTAQLMSSQ